jgi:mannose-1-phosphate guanylyltransferase/mannose-6-phosphate isomerase
VLPSDHVVRDDADAFRNGGARAMPAAEAGALVTFGIVPDAPETGFGYIQSMRVPTGEGVRQVLRFVEKPDAATAQRYLDEGGYYWNSGMFLFRATRYLEELGKYRSDIVAAARAACDAPRSRWRFPAPRQATRSPPRPSESIDYAVMEKTDAAMVLPVDIGWNDVGSWSALWDVSEQDGDGNAHHGDVIAIDSRNSYAYAQRLVALVGVDDLVVVETDDAVLVAREGQSAGGQGRGRDAEVAAAHAGCAASRSASPVGQLRLGRCRRRLPGQADQGQAGRSDCRCSRTTRRAEHWIVVRGPTTRRPNPR